MTERRVANPSPIDLQVRRTKEPLNGIMVPTLRVHPGYRFYEQEDPATGLIILREGVAVLTTRDLGGKDVGELVRAPSVLGEEILTRQQQYTSAAEALTQCKIHMLDKKLLRELLDVPGFAAALLVTQSVRVQALRNRIIIDAQPATLRVARVLLDLHEIGEKYSLPPLIQRFIAQLAGTSRESVVKIMKELEKKGALVREKGKRTVNVEALREIAEEAE